MPKVEPLKDFGEITVGYAFLCPGCQNPHLVTIRPHKNTAGASWDFNGDLDHPTFSPSLLTKIEFTDTGVVHICHSFVVNGQIRFLSDCTHKLAGQVVPMEEIEEL